MCIRDRQITDPDVELATASERDTLVNRLTEQVVPEAEHPGRHRANQRAQPLPPGRLAGRATEHGTQQCKVDVHAEDRCLLDQDAIRRREPVEPRRDEGLDGVGNDVERTTLARCV